MLHKIGNMDALFKKHAPKKKPEQKAKAHMLLNVRANAYNKRYQHLFLKYLSIYAYKMKYKVSYLWHGGTKYTSEQKEPVMMNGMVVDFAKNKEKWRLYMEDIGQQAFDFCIALVNDICEALGKKTRKWTAERLVCSDKVIRAALDVAGNTVIERRMGAVSRARARSIVATQIYARRRLRAVVDKYVT